MRPKNFSHAAIDSAEENIVTPCKRLQYRTFELEGLNVTSRLKETVLTVYIYIT